MLEVIRIEQVKNNLKKEGITIWDYFSSHYVHHCPNRNYSSCSYFDINR